MTTGERIKMLRKELRMNQTEFAKEIAVSTTTVCQLETGKFSPSRTTKTILCNRFNVNPEWLETGEGEMHVTGDTAEALIPELIDILNENKALLSALRCATKVFDASDWSKLNAFVAMIGEKEAERQNAARECASDTDV